MFAKMKGLCEGGGVEDGATITSDVADVLDY
jgi:hypothetical protein